MGGASPFQASHHAPSRTLTAFATAGRIPPASPHVELSLLPQRSWKQQRGNAATVVASAGVAAPAAPSPAAQRPPAKRLASRNPLDPSGQPAGRGYGTPVCGRPEPLGTTFNPANDGVNFALYSGSATAVWLVLFKEEDMVQGRVTQEVQLDPSANRTGDIWHILLPNMDTSLLYGYRLEGPHQDVVGKAYGHRFDRSAIVVDPYARGVIGRRRFGELGPELDYSRVPGFARTWPQAAGVLPSGAAAFDWEGDRPLNLPMEDLVIYEMHVRGFTQHPSSRVAAPGTYQGLIEKLDYLQRLGVNAIELLPIHEFNELEYYALIPGGNGEYRFNFWGYSTVSFFAPMARYSAAAAQGLPGELVATEFKQLVKAAHARGIEVILDVVFNHTAEGNEQGPTLSFRGLDNRVYYMLAPEGQYYNYSGCGNTLNCNHPVVRKFIVDCLRYWVTEMHIDGFRFDLGSILTRAHSLWHPDAPLHSLAAPVPDTGLMMDGAGAPTGTPLTDPPLVEMISEDPVLRNTKMIAEAWDCDGLNQVGAFPHYGGRWSEWNGQFRDVVRNFLKGTEGPFASSFAGVMCGSPHIYAATEAGEADWWGSNGGARWRGGRGPNASINFITAHDGFTLADLVAYNEKHNEANGEGNRDGEQHNLSWNCGEEGETGRGDVQRLRGRQMRNMAAALLLAHGVPMLQMGDEYGHSKAGNNNTYCHDSELNWFDWDAAAQDAGGFARFVRRLLAFRRQRRELRRGSYVQGGGVQWHGALQGKPDWSESSRLVAYTLASPTAGGLYIAFNTGHLPITLQLPAWPGRSWQLLADTGKMSPFDFLVADEALSEAQVATCQADAGMWTLDGLYPLLPWASIILVSVPDYQAPQPLPALARQTRTAPASPSAPNAVPSARSVQSELSTSHQQQRDANAPQAAAGAVPAAAAEKSPDALAAAKRMASKIAQSKQDTGISDTPRMSPAEQAAYDAAVAENAKLRAKLGLKGGAGL